MTHPTPKPGPKPGPRPGIKPGPRPGAQAAGTKSATPSAAPAAAATLDSLAATRLGANVPEKWGRVADNGDVFVTSPEGERLVGSWQAGTPAEGLAHYGARFDDIVTEVGLLESRLATHPGDAAHIAAQAASIKESLATAAAVGDYASLGRHIDAVITASEEAGAAAKQAKAKAREEAIARKEALAAEAEQIGESATDWKVSGDRLRKILDEWKTIKGIDRKTDDALWKRYSKGRDSFNRRRGSHFADLDRARAAAKKAKEALVARAEEIKNSTDWAETSRAFRDLMQEWKAAGRAPREVDEKLWRAFKSAQDFFFDAKNAVSSERDREFEANAEAKQQLIDAYDAQIAPEQNLDNARKKLHELQEKWEEIGFVPKARVREFEAKIEALEKRVADAADAQWRRTDPAAQARAAQFTAKVTEFTQQAEAAEKAGNAKKAQELRAQAAQWQEWADAALSAVEDR